MTNVTAEKWKARVRVLAEDTYKALEYQEENIEKWPRPEAEGFRMILDAAIIIGSLWIS
jgi:hypothetical protein